MKLLDKIKKLPRLRSVESFCVGAMLSCAIVLSIPAKTEEVVVVERPAVERVAVRLDTNDIQQIECMTQNAYFEARGEPERGIIAVNNVVMNRVSDGRFPRTPCGVINQRSRGVCQFSWKCQGDHRIRDWSLYRRIESISENVYLGNHEDVTNGAQFYHANYVRPYWSRVFDRTIVIGAHIFYRG